jgi:hypothetical protein
MTLEIYDTIQPGDSFDVEEWAGWLSGQGININNVQRIRFTGRKMKVYRYASNPMGRKFVRRNGHIAMLPPLRRTVLTAPPTWTHRQ